MDANADSSRDKEPMLLVYVNGSHEYAIFDPRESEEVVISKNKHKKIQAEEPGEYCRFVALFLNALFLYFTGYIFTSPAQPLLLAPVSQMVFCGKQTKYSSNAVITMPASYMLCSLCFQMLFAGFFLSVPCAKMIVLFFLLCKSAVSLFQHQSATLLFTESLQNWSQRKKFQMFHSSLRTGLGKPYSAGRLMFSRLSQNYALHSCHRCWRNGLLQTSEPP